MIKDFESILIQHTASVKDAMKQLDKTAEKILFVIDQGGALIGSLTDGDIRRWILHGGGLDGRSEEVCYKMTYTVSLNYDIDVVKKEVLEKKIVYVPVLDDKRHIVEFLVWDNLFEGRIRKKPRGQISSRVAIMAGGMGTRLDPFTRILPKPLVPIGDKPILEIILERFGEFGAKKFYVSVNHKSKVIKSYFEDLGLPYELTYLEETVPLGTAGGLKLIRDKLDSPLLVTNCDILIEADYFDLVQSHNEKRNDITLVVSLKHHHIPYGVCEIGKEGNLMSIVEKPEQSYFANTGMYVLEPSVLELIPPNRMFHMTDLISEVTRRRGKTGVYPINENDWLDIGEWAEYRKTVKRFEN